MDDRPIVEELERLYASLIQDEPVELLQELLVAAAHGGKAMMAVIDAWLLDRAGRELLDTLEEGGEARGSRSRSLGFLPRRTVPAPCGPRSQRCHDWWPFAEP